MVSRYLSGERGTRLERRGAQAIEKIARAFGIEGYALALRGLRDLLAAPR